MARRRHSKRRRRRGSFGFLYKVLSMLVICAVAVVALTLFFRVDTIEVTGMERYTQEQVIEACGVEQGDNLFLLNKYAAANRLIARLPYVRGVRISRDLPDTLVIRVEECGTPLAVVQGGEAWLVSPGEASGGKVKIVEQIALAEARNYGKLDGCTLLSPVVGGQMTLDTAYAAQQQSLDALLHALESQGLMDQVQSIHLEDLSVLRMEYAGRFTVELPYGADYDYKLRYLQGAIAKLETNKTGTLQMTREDGKVLLIEER